MPQEYVKMIDEFGGNLPDAIGIPEDELRKAAKMDVCKINIDSDSRLAMTAAVRKVMHDHPEEFDPRKYLGPAREEMVKLYKHKIIQRARLGRQGKIKTLLRQDITIRPGYQNPRPYYYMSRQRYFHRKKHITSPL